MVTDVANRLRRMTVTEIAFRTREKRATLRERLQYVAGLAQWDRRRLSTSVLAGSDPVLVKARARLRANDWIGAHTALREYFLHRPSRFVLQATTPEKLALLIRSRYPAATDGARTRADELRAGKYDLLGYRALSFRSAIGDPDWHLDPVHGRRAPSGFWADVPYLQPTSGDHKIIWELNRHQHWLALGRAAWLTGDRSYATGMVGELDSWLAANPPLTGMNWASMLELALRSISWMWALHLFLPFADEKPRPWIVDLLVGLQRQLDQVAAHLSYYFSPNTHLLGEGLALYVGGRVLPELRSAERWERLGRTILLEASTRQIHPDGGHAELSPHYHRYALDFYLLALVIARKTNDPFAESCARTVERLATFCRTLANDAGQLPTIGDDDGGLLFPMCGRSPADASDTLWLAAMLLERPDLAVGEPPEEVVWMTGADVGVGRPTGRAPKSVVFPDTGYAVLRTARDHVVFDGGYHGFLNGGHAHADALSIVLAVDGRPFLVDPGTATYTTDPELRDRFRSTQMHNTLVLDGRPQSVPHGPFHWKSRANGRVEVSRTEGLLYVEGSHDGYLPMVHRRAIVCAYGVWMVVDHVLGSGQHTATTFWHLAPEWSVLRVGGGTDLVHSDGLRAAVATTATDARHWAGGENELAYSSPVYGRVVPSPTLMFSVTGQASFSLAAAVAAAAQPVDLAVECVPVTTDVADGWHRAAFLVRRDGCSIVALFATPPATGNVGQRSIQRIAVGGRELITDGRTALLAFSPTGEPSALDQIDGRVAAWTGEGAFELVTESTAGDLHCDAHRLRRARGARSWDAGAVKDRRINVQVG